MICPVCLANAPAAGTSGRIAICGACGYTVVDDGTHPAVRATIRDIEALSTEELTRLRKIRTPIVGRKAAR